MSEARAVVSPQKRQECESLFAEFLRGYPPSNDGMGHIKRHIQARKEARDNYVKALAMVEAGKDATDFILRHFIPHNDNAPNKTRDVWIHPAPFIRKDVILHYAYARKPRF